MLQFSLHNCNVVLKLQIVCLLKQIPYVSSNRIAHKQKEKETPFFFFSLGSNAEAQKIAD